MASDRVWSDDREHRCDEFGGMTYHELLDWSADESYFSLARAVAAVEWDDHHGQVKDRY